MNVSVSKLPGIGQKITFETAEDNMLVLIVHHTGKRELYFFEDADSDEADFAMDLTADETRELGAQLLGATYQPVDVDKVKLLKSQIIVDWVEVKTNSPFTNKTIEEAEIRNKTGATVMGVVKGDETIAVPDADTVLNPGDVLMVMGKKEHVDNFESLCKGEEG
ncbi:cation:proton antiporter regulatory subunit [Salirhabdus salicampi]|uniref:cation:proton antiporter regulatory subunit n=1 Tax=Salirhabdus salicampi TaxID=476102 RepID=UPI0020C4A48C|nr:TrkA C-terminal domain-containing protein [Salirhabdus salicampi]MCP8617772.1 potassium transporter TrkA [Salirhabdus salicampi]